ncbi:hypothetical protein CT0861_09783 [Colletotrichum tofieldiae]|uniref:RNA polymerase sigma factor 70 region 4 type 2 domain-containing protein n=1 Tax=Colletotrichum tofieldiae TaxID=708197 RepID=A0A166UDA3_9PEZI|nr:hypothetical protein CT0861_09783 [Colletotrichum tofieldiae]
MDAQLQEFTSVISGDRRTNDELSEIQRVAITAFVLAGRSYREAARAFNCSLGAVHKTLRRFNASKTFTSGPRKGRPKKISQVEKRKSGLQKSTTGHPIESSLGKGREGEPQGLNTAKLALRRVH